MIPNIKYQCLIPKVRNIAEKKFPSECDDILKNNNILYKTPGKLNIFLFFKR